MCSPALFNVQGAAWKHWAGVPPLLNSVLKVRNAWVEVEWVEREELSVNYITVVIKGKKRDQSTEG